MSPTLKETDEVMTTQTGWLDRFSQVMGRCVPDAITAAIIFMLMVAGTALVLGTSPAQILDAYSQGFWSLLAFTMQMILIVTLSSVLSATLFFAS
jgi:short-chain fatty acids transporter